MHSEKKNQKNYKKYSIDSLERETIQNRNSKKKQSKRIRKNSKNFIFIIFDFFVFIYKDIDNKISKVHWPKTFTRFNTILFIIFSIYIYFIFTLYTLQIVDGEKYKKIVDGNASGYDDPKKITNRGEIYFTNKKGEKIVAAGMKTIYKLILSPADIKNKDNLYIDLKNIANIDKEKYLKLVEKKKSKYQLLEKSISFEQKEKIRKLKNKAAYIEEETKRFYPLGDVGSEILGFVATDKKDATRKGMYGLEKQYERVLSYSDSLKATGLFKKIFNSSKRFLSPKIITDDGYVETNIDMEVQKKLQTVLKNIDKQYSSEFSSGIVVKPYSGEVVAMGTSKAFDSNTNPHDYRIVQIENRYEFGSIFKPLIVATGLDTKSITKNFSFNDKGYMVLNKKRIQNYDGVGRGPGTNIYKIISQSLNTGVAVIALRIGATKLVSYLDKLGLSTETNIDLPGETFGNISNLNSGEDIEVATASFGQGISLTAVGMVKAMSAIASGGTVPDLHIAKKVVYKHNIDDYVLPIKKKRVFTSGSANFMRDIMVKSADNVLKNGKMKREFHTIALKTGTAQIVNPKGGYYKHKNIHSFIGFFPANAPVKERYLVFLYTYYPKDVQYSSQTLTKPFFEITDFIINYFDLPADRNATY